MDYYAIQTGEYLEHHGIKGQKWGVRRYQNSDGSLTAAGRSKYAKDIAKSDYKTNRMQIKQEKTNSFRKYRKLDKKIRVNETKKRQMKSETGIKLSKAEENWGHKAVATKRIKTKTVRTGAIAVAALLGTVATGTAAPVVVGGLAAGISAKQIPYYVKERKTYSANSKKPSD